MTAFMNWMMKTKGDFILDLLSSKKLSLSDRERILNLSAIEFQSNGEELQKVWQEVENLKANFKTLFILSLPPHK